MAIEYKTVSQFEFARIFILGFALGGYWVHHYHTQRTFYIQPLRIFKKVFLKIIPGKKL